MTIEKFDTTLVPGPAAWPVQSELLVNGSFSNGTAQWDGFDYDGKSVAGGAATFASTPAWSSIAQYGLTLTAGKYYELSFTLSNVTAGELEPILQGSDAAVGFPARSTNGTFTARIQAGAHDTLRLLPTATTSLTLDDVSLTGPYDTATVGGA